MATARGQPFRRVHCGCAVFEVPGRYSQLQYLGAGAFSTVAKALDTRTQREVTIKKLARPFGDTQRACRTFRELWLLSQLRHPCVISLLDAFCPQLPSGQPLADVYLVTQLLLVDLKRLLEDNGRLRQQPAVSLTKKLLHGVAYLHSAGVLHRDLKPANIGIGRGQEVKILDFGLAREAAPTLSGYVFTRQYRSPEVVVCSGAYSQAADLWAVGCVLGEMLLGAMLFPGKDELDTLRLVCERLGKPSAETLAKFAMPEAEQFIADLPAAAGAGCRSLLRHCACGSDVLDLLTQLLQFDPDRRPTAEQALAHRAFCHVADSPENWRRASSTVACSIEQRSCDLRQWYQAVADLLLQQPSAAAAARAEEGVATRNS